MQTTPVLKTRRWTSGPWQGTTTLFMDTEPGEGRGGSVGHDGFPLIETNPVIFRTNLVIFRTNSVIFTTLPVLVRTNPVTF